MGVTYYERCFICTTQEESEMKRNIIMGVTAVSSVCYGGEAYASGRSEEAWMWVALFSLAMLSILILYMASLRTKKIERIYQEMFERQKQLEQNQAVLLSDIGENIYEMVTKALKKEGGKKLSKREIRHHTARDVSDIFNVEEKLLAVTNDLIEFLRLKSDKIEIVNETFNINNVLNEISGYICNRYKGKPVDLIFDINNNVPRLLIGDSLHLGQVINHILEHMMDRLNGGELKLKITMYHTFEEKIELEFQFQDTGEGITKEALTSLFDPYYDEENSTYHGLGLYVSSQLVKMMDGTLTAQSHVGKGSMFTLSLPLKIFNRENKRMYRLPTKVLTTKKVFIVDNNYNSALAIKKMFAYFRHEVKVLSKTAFLEQQPNLAPYDIVVLNKSLFTQNLLSYFKQIKEKKELKVIALNTLLERDKSHLKSDLIDVNLYTPLNQERIFEMIVGMYNIDVEKIEEDTQQKKHSVIRSEIPETSNIKQSNFARFSGKHILIVEDNIINQKVLSSLLVPAGVQLSLANNGQEAVDMVQTQGEDFNLILMDINMPILDGYAATEMIRQNPRYDTLPIVAFTALVLESEIEKMFNSGINAFLSKPLNIGKLYTALEMFLLETEEERSADRSSVQPNKPETFDGLDIEQGIAHTSHSKVLYAEVLNEFMIAYGKSDTLFEKLVKEHRYEQIKMLCVDMRGLTGTIGAYAMLDVINKIHQAILYNKQAMLPGFITEYHKEITTLNHAITSYLEVSGYQAA